jgi:predicted SAM-dependent methyltransferase
MDSNLLKGNVNIVMLNIGCGSRFHPHWINIDYSVDIAVRQKPFFKLLTAIGILKMERLYFINHDVSRGLPFQNCSIDVAYHSHFLEHLDTDKADYFVEEIYRVLKPGGIHRVVVPDLEDIVECYRLALANCREGKAGADDEYAWALIRLFDQMVRTKPGGRMQEYLDKRNLIRDTAHFRQCNWRERLKCMLGLSRANDPSALGELHRWMYDDYSLCSLLAQKGFIDVHRVSYLESRIPLWESFRLDQNPDGTPYKPDSVYVECIKPQI